jgi:small subunit ribosomal protein S16
MRLSRVGGAKHPIYRIVVADSRSPRDGRCIEILGQYNPRTEPSLIEVDQDKATEWLGKGAQPTRIVKRLLATKGIKV